LALQSGLGFPGLAFSKAESRGFPDGASVLFATPGHPPSMSAMKYGIGVILLFLGGCAFDVIHLRQAPAHFEAATAPADTWILAQDARIRLQ